jgi:hypothetical protein
VSLWDDFTSAISGVAKEIQKGPTGWATDAAKAVLPVATKVAKPLVNQFAQSGKGVLQGFEAAGYVPGGTQGSVIAKAGVSLATPQIQQLSGGQLTAQAQQSMADVVTNQTTQKFSHYDPMLAVGVAAEEHVYSPLIKRPLDAAVIAADPNSPLYDAGKYGQGFQFSDLQAAYDRSKDVSLGVAITKNLYGPLAHITGLYPEMKNAGLDLDHVSLWNDKDIKQNFTDNVLGRYMSGTTDAVVGNVAIQVATTKGLGLVKLGAEAAGLTNKIKLTDINALDNLDALATDHINYVNGNGGTRSQFGEDVVRLAKTDNINEIIDIIAPNGKSKYSNNPRLPGLIRTTQDPAVVKDFLLADKGYGPAIERLTKLNMSDDLWIMGDSAKEMNAYFIRENKLPDYSFEQRQRISKAFDDAIAKNPRHQDIYDTFMTDRVVSGPVTPEQAAAGITPGAVDSVPRMFGTNYTPMEPILGQGIYSKVRTRASELRTASVTRDFSNVGGMTQTFVGRGNAATALIKFVSTKMPRGVVTNSGLRPFDALEEINAHFDDIKLFQNGTTLIKISPTEFKTAAQYRTEFVDRYLAAPTDSARGLILDELNDKLIYDVGRTRGVNRKDLESFVTESMSNIKRYHNDLAVDSYSMDPAGIRIQVDPETQRQLRNATPLINVSSLERDILRAQGNRAAQIKDAAAKGIDSVYEFGNKAFSFTQLVRPSYISKNSIIEPMIVSMLSHGSKAITDEFSTTMKNAILNNKNRVLRGIDKAKDLTSSQKSQIKNEFELLTQQYSDKVELVENHIAEYAQYFVNEKGRSPQSKIENSAMVKLELNRAEKELRDIEVKLGAAAPEFTTKIKSQPTLYNLTRRVVYLEKLGNPAYASDIANAKAAIVKASGAIETLAPDLKTLDAEIKKAYEGLENNIQDFGTLHAKNAEIFSVSENRQVKYGSQQPFNAVMPNGEIVSIAQYGDTKNFGREYQSEVANTHTRQIELTGDKIFGHKIKMFNRLGPAEVTDISSPHYFDELAFVANNYMRGDILVDQILAGRSRAELLQWGQTRQGSSYAAEFGKDKQDIVAIIDRQINYINRYIPNQEAQRLVGMGEVNGNQLAKILSKNPQDLTPIHPLDVAYSIKTNGVANFAQTMERLTSAAWVALAKPENKIRYAWASTEYKSRVTDKLAALQTQGFSIDPTIINGVRQAAAAEVVKELEKTFYSIRRTNRALFTARTVMSFPTAAASGIYRYARLGLKNPARFGGFLNSYYGLYNSFGVDKYGNPVDRVQDADYFIVPGTKEMGINNGRGLLLSSRATNFAVNFPGPSYLVPIAVGQIYERSPIHPKNIKATWNALPASKIPGYSYDELFPLGVETNFFKASMRTVQPGWFPALNKYLSANGDGSVDWNNSVLSEFQYQTMLYNNNQGPEPTNASVISAAKKNFRNKFLWQTLSIFGSPAYVETKKFGVVEDFFRAKADGYYAQVDQNTGNKVYTRTEAANLAEQDVNTMLRMPQGTVSSDLLQIKNAGKVTYTPNTPETKARIYDEHPALSKALEAMDKTGSLVGLMTADLPFGTDPQVGKFLNDPNRTLPGGTILNKSIKSVDQLNTQLEVSSYWKAYIDVQKQYDDAAKAAGYVGYQSVPSLVEQLKGYAKTLGKASTAWNAAFIHSMRGDSAVLQAAGLQTVLNNKKWMDQYGNSNFWTHAQAFMKYRNSYVELYQNAPTGSKGDVQAAWTDYLQKSVHQWDPSLANLIERYFYNDKLKSTNIKPLNVEGNK